MTTELVKNKATLKSLAKKGHFTFPPRFGGGFQIDETVNGKDQPIRFKEYSRAYTTWKLNTKFVMLTARYLF